MMLAMTDAPTPAPASSRSDRDPTSILGQLGKRREAIAAAQVLTKKVPRWRDPVIEVDYGLVDHDVVSRAQRYVNKAVQDQPRNRAERRASGGKGDSIGRAELDANCDVLIAGCQAVVAVIDGVRYSLREGDPHGEPTTFDPDLADNLGLPDDDRDARAVVKALFISEGDIIRAAREVAEFSGYTLGVVDEELEGE
jgi:hypothetical protein